MLKEELETIINYNQAEDLAVVDTCDKSLQRKLAQIAASNPTIVLVREDEHGQTYSFPKKWVKIRPPRQISDEKRREMVERAKRNFTNTEDVDT